MLTALVSDFSQLPEKEKPGETVSFLEAYIVRKQKQIDEILQVVERYEKKRAMEERAYQTMSPLKRMFSGRKPDHHLAVEYIHYVRKPMEQVRKLRSEIDIARAAMKEYEEKGSEAVVPDSIRKEMV